MFDEDDMSSVFQALASGSRRLMLDRVMAAPGITVGELAKGFDVSRVAVMKHLRVLESADLIVSRKTGRIRKLYFNAVPIQLIYERWSSDYSSYWSAQLTTIKSAAERQADGSKNSGEKKND